MNQRKTFGRVLLVVALAMIAPQLASGDDADRFAFDKRFVKEAGEWAMANNQVSRLAFDHSHSDGVKHYAEKVIDGQKKLLDELHDIAAHHDYHIPDEMTPEQRDKMHHLEQLQNTDFDVQYMSDQRIDERAMYDLFDEARKTCKDDNLRDFAARKLPALADFRDNAEELYKKVKDKERP
jgi:predicted outer membrane protein